MAGSSYATILQTAASAQEFSNLITRNSAGQIIAISQTNANLFKTNLSGLDAGPEVSHPSRRRRHDQPVGQRDLLLPLCHGKPNGTWADQVDQGLNQVSTGGVISRFRYTAQAVYEVGPYGLSLTENFQKRYHDAASSITEEPRFVSAYQTVNGQVFYTGLKSFKFTLGVKNLFNRDPPYANYAATTNNFIGGYDVSYGDPLGRFVYASVAYSMR